MKYYNLGSNPPSFAASIDTLLEGASVEDTTPTTEHKVSGKKLSDNQALFSQLR